MVCVGVAAVVPHAHRLRGESHLSHLNPGESHFVPANPAYPTYPGESRSKS